MVAFVSAALCGLRRGKRGTGEEQGGRGREVSELTIILEARLLLGEVQSFQVNEGWSRTAR